MDTIEHVTESEYNLLANKLHAESDRALIRGRMGMTLARYKISSNRIFRLQGPAMKHIRQDIIQAITLEHRPMAKCGINAIRDLLYTIFDAQGECIAEREKDVVKKLDLV